MSKQRKELRILLCQVRQEQAMLDHELDCFARAGDLRKEQFVQLDLLKSLEFDMLALKIFDAIVVGGSGDYGVPEFVKTFPIGAAMLGMILQQAKQDNIPVFGVCFGIQFDAHIAGGELAESEEELGTVELSVAPEADSDAVLKGISASFKSQSGHKWAVSRMPQGASLLVTGTRCKVQMYKYQKYPNYYCAQFHPELTKSDLLFRMEHYPDYEPEGGREKFLAGLEETPDAPKIFAGFLDRVVLRD